MYFRPLFVIIFVNKIKTDQLEEEWRTVTNWFRQFGDISPFVGLGIGPAGRGLFAKEHLPPNYLLLTVPANSIISVEVALKARS